MFTLDDLLDIAVKMETNGEAIYRKAAQEAPTPEMAQLLTWMADQEACHRQWFLDRKSQFAQAAPPAQEGVLSDILNEMMGDKSLSLDDVDFSTITSPARLLEVFCEFETDTLLFYDFLEAFLDSPEALDGLQQIKAEETAHVTQLTQMARDMN